MLSLILQNKEERMAGIQSQKRMGFKLKAKRT